MKQTTRSLLTTLVILAGGAAIGGVALWVNKDVQKQAEQKEKSAKVFDGLDRARVRNVALSRDGKLVAAISRADTNASWKLVEPIQADADPPQIDAMVAGVADLRQKSEIGEGDGKQYGFDPPRMVV